MIELYAIALTVACACSLVGVFLVLRRLSMLADSITHTVLLGIVVAFFATGSLNSPWLLFGASAVGVLTAWSTGLLERTGLVNSDCAVGLIFPLFFSLAVLLISRYARSVHLDVDTVLLGELAFAPFDRVFLWGRDFGPKGMYTAGFLLVLNLTAVIIFFKELKISTFDGLLAASFGFSPVMIHYGLMTLVSLTAVGSFQAVGAVLVVAFMVGPPSTALLLTADLKRLLWLSPMIGAVASALGLWGALVLDVSIAGSMAVAVSGLYAVAVLAAPRKGLAVLILRRRAQKRAVDEAAVMMHLCHHRFAPTARQENGINTLCDHLHWSSEKTIRVLARLVEKEYVVLQDDVLSPTDEGLKEVRRMVVDLI